MTVRAMIVMMGLLGVAAGCEDGRIGSENVPGFLDSCLLPEDCPSANMVCMQVTNQHTGFLTDDRYCTIECGDTTQCPTADCEDYRDTELACLESAEISSYCGPGRLGDADFTVCGI